MTNLTGANMKPMTQAEEYDNNVATKESAMETMQKTTSQLQGEPPPEYQAFGTDHQENGQTISQERQLVEQTILLDAWSRTS